MLLPILLASCGSTKVKKKIELAPLANDKYVEVYTTLPPFQYEVVCEIDISRSGNFVATDMESYKSNVAAEARKCGADKGLIENLHGWQSSSGGADIKVKAYAIRQTSETDRLQGENVKSLATAAAIDNLPALKEILKEVNTKPESRSTQDNLIMEHILYLTSKKGLKCPPNMTNLFIKNYGVTLNKFDYEERNFISSQAHEIVFCSEVFEKSYANFQNKDEVRRVFNDALISAINEPIRKDRQKKISKINRVMPLIAKDVDAACKKDALSAFCVYEKQLKDFKKLTK